MSRVTDQPGRPRVERTPSLTVEFHDWTDLGPPLPFEQIPEWLRLPGEPGYLELDRYMRRVNGKGGSG
jgi:hypothetical protein